MIGSDTSTPLTIAETTLVYSYTPDGMEYRLARAIHLAGPQNHLREGSPRKRAVEAMNTTSPKG